VWHLQLNSGQPTLEEALSIVKTGDTVLYNGAPKEEGELYSVGHFNRVVVNGEEVESSGPLGPFAFLSTVEQSDVVRFPKASFEHEGAAVSVWYQAITTGSQVMQPGLKFKVDEGATVASKLNFVSLMLALFLGTSALPHILIRYYTVSSPKAARRSTIAAIAAIGLFYVLTLFMGLAAMGSGIMDVESSNMAAPLLARNFGVTLFAFISAIAFATVLGTVSGLIVAAAGAIAHDIIDNVMQKSTSDTAKVAAGKISAVVVGAIAILLGITLKGMNVGFLVGLAFAVAASANLPSILMVLFWKRTTSQGIVASITVGMVSSLGLILLSPSFFERFGLDPSRALFPLDNPGIVSIPLSFLVLLVVSLATNGVAGKLEAAHE
jgi:cation/acetate symporter